MPETLSKPPASSVKVGRLETTKRVAVAALNQLYSEEKENPKLIETVEQHKNKLSEILRDFENHKFSPPLL